MGGTCSQGFNVVKVGHYVETLAFVEFIATVMIPGVDCVHIAEHVFDVFAVSDLRVDNSFDTLL